MVFNSHIFIFLAFPLTFCGYYLCAKKSVLAQKSFLLFASLVMYVYGSVQSAIYILITAAVNYFFLNLLHKNLKHRKAVFVTALIFNIALLLYCKYTNFFISNINSLFKSDYNLLHIFVPLGISFITFQQIMLLVETYNRKSPSYGVVDYLLYVLYFPKILMGPITKPEELIEQWNIPAKIDFELVSKGIIQFSGGLFKKMILATTFSSTVNQALSNYKNLSSLECFVVMLCYTFEIYFDFSGYSDMAIGLSNMLGIKLPINFDSPYKAISVRDFWKRWHISLTSFLTKYVYFPLGGSKKGTIRTYLNILVVFLVSGLWHGASWTFVIWGLLNGCFSIFDRVFDKIQSKIPKFIRWIFTFAVINILWLLFRAESVSQWYELLKNAFSFGSLSFNPDIFNYFNLSEFTAFTAMLNINIPNIAFFLLFAVFSLLLCLLAQNNYKRPYKLSVWQMILCSVELVWGILSLVGESTFVYLSF